jgi:hypothetical protein
MRVISQITNDFPELNFEGLSPHGVNVFSCSITSKDASTASVRISDAAALTSIYIYIMEGIEIY